MNGGGAIHRDVPAAAGGRSLGRLHTLDGIRGTAAVFVLFGHGTELFLPLPVPRFWLSVDLFFLMSGFVLAHVYEPRLAGGMTATQFMVSRYIRLYPLYLVGLLIGIASGAVTLWLGKGNLDAPGFAAAVVTGLLLLPSPTWNETTSIVPLNFPGWSLVFELLANLVFAVLWPRLSNRLLLAIVTLSALAMIAAFQIGDPFAGQSWIGIGWGLPRIGYSFFLGVLLQRFHPGPRFRSNLAWLPLLAIAALMFAYPSHGALFDAFLLLAGFPALVWVAVLVEPRRAALFGLLGSISYPIYVLHMPVLSIIWRASIFFGRPLQSFAPWLGIVFAVVLAAAAVLLDRRYDAPVRRWITLRIASRLRPSAVPARADVPL